MVMGQSTGLSSIGANLTPSFNGNVKYGIGNGTTLFNTDGSIPAATSRYKDNKGYINNDQWSGNMIGGKNMGNLGMWKMEGSTIGGVVDTSQNAGQQNLVNGTQGVAGAQNTSPLAQYMSGGQQTGTVTVAQPGVQNNGDINWGDSVNIANQPNGSYVNPGQIDKVNPAKMAVKKLAGKLLKLSQELNDEEFNELVKLFDLADIKDDFVQRSGRQNSYLDRQLLVEALNQCHMVFLENNTKNANLQNQLQQMATTLNNTGIYDAANVYNFMLEAVGNSAIPMNIANDPARQHLARVIQMAVNYKNKGNNVGGVNWNQNNMNSNQGGFGMWNSNQNNSGGLWNAGNNMGGSIWDTSSQNNNQSGLTGMLGNWNSQSNNQSNFGMNQGGGDMWTKSLNMLNQGGFNQSQTFNSQLPAYGNQSLNNTYNNSNNFIQSNGASMNFGGNGFGNQSMNNQSGFGFNSQSNGQNTAGFNWASLNTQPQQANNGVVAGNGIMTANGLVC